MGNREQTDNLACGAKMSLSRIPFEEAKKCLTVSSIPKSLLHALAMYLDTLCGESNWEYLAEQLGVSTQEIEWVKNTAMHCPMGSPTFRLFDAFLIHRDILLEKFLEALETIKNFASVKVVTEGYTDGAFDSTLKYLMSNGHKMNAASLKDQSLDSVLETCKSYEYHPHSPPTFHRPENCCDCPGHNCHRIKSENFQKVPSYDGSCHSFDGSSTYCGADGCLGDTVSCTRCILDRSFIINRSDGCRIAAIEAMSHVDDGMPSLGEAGEVLDLSKGGHAKSKSVVKVEPRCCHSSVKSEEVLKGNGVVAGQHCCNCCSGDRQVEDKCRHCACGQHLARVVHESRLFRSLPEFAKCKPPDRDETIQKPTKKPGRRECALIRGDSPPCCCSLNDSNFHQKNNGIVKTCSARGPIIQKRDKMAPCPPGRRVTHPLLKEDMDKSGVKKNPDGTSPVRTTGSSYGVVQQSPFTKDWRCIRVFVTYADDSKKHMKCVLRLCECLKKNNFSVSLDVRETGFLSPDRIGWNEKRFRVADYVLVLISPKYFLDVTEPDRSKETSENELALNTLYIHRCMQVEYMDNNCANKRFIPVLMPDASKSHVPIWLQNTTRYVWPEQYKNLFFYMMSNAHDFRVTCA